ncbi:hypothetical protein TNCV_587121 [Trichonephila clavipes]|nr:hypothetical protein TNCV_587121 [Trichonephila clavipes]
MVCYTATTTRKGMLYRSDANYPSFSAIAKPGREMRRERVRVILTVHYEAGRGLLAECSREPSSLEESLCYIGDGLRYFEPWSSDADDT